MTRQPLVLGPTGQQVSWYVRERRKGLRLSFRVLAERMQLAGRPISESALKRIESGKRRVDTDDLTALSACLECTVADLLYGSDPAPPVWLPRN